MCKKQAENSDRIRPRRRCFRLVKATTRLSAVSGASTYPANRDFEGHVGGVRGAAPQGIFLFYSIFFDFFCQIFKEKKGDVLTNI